MKNEKEVKIMRKFKMLTMLCAVLMVFAMAPSVQALTDVTYDITSNHMTAGQAATGPFGTVRLEQIGFNVRFTVTLANSGDYFIRTGAGDGYNFKFNYDYDNDFADTISFPADFSTSLGLTAFDAGSPILCGDAGGCYQYGVFFTGQTTGASPANQLLSVSPLTFTIAGATLDEFLEQNNLNQIFVADIYNAETGATGLVDVTGTGVPLPEPYTLLLLGLGLIGVAGMRRFRK